MLRPLGYPGGLFCSKATGSSIYLFWVMRMDEYYQVIRHLPISVYHALRSLPSGRAMHVQEIRIHCNQPIVLFEGSHSYTFPVDEPLIVPPKLLEECIYSLSGYSLHSKQDTLHEGYFTLPGGHRVGVAGEMACRADKLIGYRHFSSVIIRIARTGYFAPDHQLIAALQSFRAGLLIVGPPGSGKTTVLRSLAAVLSEWKIKSAVIDSRMEIFPAGCISKVPLYCDVLSGVPRAQGIELALRTLSPQVILCDEIGSPQDAEAIGGGTNAGVRFISTMHGDNGKTLKLRPQYTALQKYSSFDTIAYLCGTDHPGAVKEIEKVDVH